jgi:predicted lactoylglutathione lyase
MTESLDNEQPITNALPVADRRTTFAFYAEGLGFHSLGDPGEDGVFADPDGHLWQVRERYDADERR